jgi:hypothetical protein
MCLVSNFVEAIFHHNEILNVYIFYQNVKIYKVGLWATGYVLFVFKTEGIASFFRILFSNATL